MSTKEWQLKLLRDLANEIESGETEAVITVKPDVDIRIRPRSMLDPLSHVVIRTAVYLGSTIEIVTVKK